MEQSTHLLAEEGLKEKEGVGYELGEQLSGALIYKMIACKLYTGVVTT